MMDEGAIALREATEADTPAIDALWTRTRRVAGAEPPTPDESRTISEIHRRGELWVAETPEEIVGFVAATEDAIERIVVDAEFRRSGIGTALLGWVLRDGRARDAVPSPSPEARAFFESAGFHETLSADGTRSLRSEADDAPRRP